MNCAQSHELLLDLAYGELPPTQAAEVETHVASCPACRAEKEHLDEARRMAAPLRELEEPPAGFDEPILRAARAEAGMQAEGTPGPIVEVSASVKPLGLQAARLDPHARMRRGVDEPRPRWGRRAAVVGSIAAAAGLAVVVTSSLTTRPAMMPRDEVAPIRVRAPSAPVPGAVEEALPKPQTTAALPDRRATPATPASPPARAPARRADKTELAKARPTRESQPAAAAKKDQSSDLARSRVSQDAAADSRLNAISSEPGSLLPPAVQPLQQNYAAGAESVRPGTVQGTASAEREAKLAAKRTKAAESRADAVAPQKEEPPQLAQRSVGGTLQTVPAQSVPAAMPSAPPATAGATAPRTADQLEDEASAARRRGDYSRAGSLYRDASALRKESEPARAAWDLAHAVECLAAGGLMAEAIASRKELLRSFPDHAGPRAAADSALRSVRLPPDEKPAPAR